MIQHIQQITVVYLKNANIESLFSKNDEPLPKSIFAVCHDTNSETSDLDEEVLPYSQQFSF